MHNPIQQDWLLEYRVDNCCDVEKIQLPANASESQTPLGITLPLFIESHQTDSPVVKGVDRKQLQQLRGPAVAATRPRKGANLESSQGGDTSRSKGERGGLSRSPDPVREHLDSAMHLAESLRGPAKKCSYRQRKTTGVLICQHLLAALKLADHDGDDANSQPIPGG